MCGLIDASSESQSVEVFGRAAQCIDRPLDRTRRRIFFSSSSASASPSSVAARSFS
jgi:hypothetical protein